MRYFSVYEIIRSIFFSALSGVVLGCIYKASVCVLVAIKSCVLFIPSVINLLPGFKISRIHELIRFQKIHSINPASKNVFEFCLFLFFGIYFILLNYIILDGIFRIYILFILIAMFFVAIKTFGKFFSYIFYRSFDLIYFSALFIACVMLFPIYNILRLIFIPLRCLYSKFKVCRRLRKSDKLIRKKVSEARKNMLI